MPIDEKRDDIILGPDDVALIIRKDQSLGAELHIPEYEPDEPVPNHVQWVSALGMLISRNDEEFFQFVSNRWVKFVDEYNKQQEAEGQQPDGTRLIQSPEGE